MRYYYYYCFICGKVSRRKPSLTNNGDPVCPGCIDEEERREEFVEAEMEAENAK